MADEMTHAELFARVQRTLDRQFEQLERDLNRPAWKNGLIMAGQIALTAGVLGLAMLILKQFF